MENEITQATETQTAESTAAVENAEQPTTYTAEQVAEMQAPLKGRLQKSVARIGKRNWTLPPRQPKKKA